MAKQKWQEAKDGTTKNYIKNNKMFKKSNNANKKTNKLKYGLKILLKMNKLLIFEVEY
jgi:hypothetical protein